MSIYAVNSRHAHSLTAMYAYSLSIETPFLAAANCLEVSFSGMRGGRGGPWAAPSALYKGEENAI